MLTETSNKVDQHNKHTQKTSLEKKEREIYSSNKVLFTPNAVNNTTTTHDTEFDYNDLEKSRTRTSLKHYNTFTRDYHKKHE